MRNGVVGLTDALNRASPEQPAWSWAPEQTVGFTLRRQTHEALTHCVDGLLAAGLPLPTVSPELAADGVDEVVNVMLGEPDAAASGTITLRATNTNDQWTVGLGSTDLVISGAALDLNLWLWGRNDGASLSMAGDLAQAEALREIISSNTE